MTGKNSVASCGGGGVCPHVEEGIMNEEGVEQDSDDGDGGAGGESGKR